MHDYKWTWKSCKNNDMNSRNVGQIEIPQLIPSKITVSIKYA